MIAGFAMCVERAALRKKDDVARQDRVPPVAMKEMRLRGPGAECIIDLIGVYIQTSFAWLLPPEAQDLRVNAIGDAGVLDFRSEEHTTELQSLMGISYAVFSLKIKNPTI